MSEHIDNLRVVAVIPITADNLPKGNFYEADGSCWRYIRCDPRVEGCEWRLQPVNWQAFGKGEPDSELSDVFIPSDFADRARHPFVVPQDGGEAGS